MSLQWFMSSRRREDNQLKRTSYIFFLAHRRRRLDDEVLWADSMSRRRKDISFFHFRIFVFVIVLHTAGGRGAQHTLAGFRLGDAVRHAVLVHLVQRPQLAHLRFRSLIGGGLAHPTPRPNTPLESASTKTGARVAKLRTWRRPLKIWVRRPLFSESRQPRSQEL